MKAVLAVVAFLGASLGFAHAQPVSTFNQVMVASDNVRATAPTIRGGFDVLKEFQVLHGGSVRISWKFRTTNPATGVQVIVRPLTGGPFERDECFKFTVSATFVSESCDLNVPAGVVIQVVGTGCDTCRPNARVVLRDVTLAYDLVEMDGPSTVLSD